MNSMLGNSRHEENCKKIVGESILWKEMLCVYTAEVLFKHNNPTLKKQPKNPETPI